MAQILGPSFGSGSDGVLTISTNTTDSPIDSACTGTSGATSLTATNASFAAGKLIMVHQTRGTGVGQWEINKIGSYSAGTITTVSPLSYTYASGAQVLIVEQHSGISVASGITLTAKAWNGSVGGILGLMSSGSCTVTGTITAEGKGFRNNNDTTAANGVSGLAYQGEGNTGTGSRSHSANANAGGGGQSESSSVAKNATGGGGGSHATNGSSGTKGVSGEGAQAVGVGATTTVGNATLTEMQFGGSGGNGGSSNDDQPSTDWGWGGDGGGIVLIYANALTVTGSLSAKGGTAGTSNGWGGGGGAGGSVLIKAKTATLGTSKVTAAAGAGEKTSGSNDWSGIGGDGGSGRIRAEACSLTGTTSPTLSSDIGGQSYCGSSVLIF